MTTRTGYVHHSLYLWHDTGTSAGLPPAHAPAGVQPLMHFEHPDTKRRLHELIEVSGLLPQLVSITPRPATEAEILRVHNPHHLAHIRSQSALPKGGDAGDGFSPIGRGSYEIALLAAGGVIELVSAVVKGAVTNGYALVRPPGHHATADAGMGFCVFNNIAVAIRHAQAELGVERVAVLDWDVHHGNGTQSIFYRDPSVLTISLHQANCFPPNSGAHEEQGEGDGFGCAINVPLPPGTGPAGYMYAMDEVVIPALDQFRPDMILVASGFDASVLDPLGRQMLGAVSYAELTAKLMDAADRLCGGRVVMAHEGGYAPQYVPYCGLAVLETLSGVKTGVEDPLADVVAGWLAEPLLDAQRTAVDAAAWRVARIANPPMSSVDQKRGWMARLRGKAPETQPT
ncbi:class II histone deacetylase [Micromonospora sp. NPDC006766]|uniref:class II histone deacetylase n=1 Tax=Micromonospora sp. NPDC006766 TaxID=3154778 RepID=UPI0033D0BC0C